MNLDTDLVSNIRINLSAIERRTSTLIKRRTVKKEYQVAWLLKTITLLDLTTLSGDDTFGKVEKLCIKGLNPISDLILKRLNIQNDTIKVGAICVYHDLISHAKSQLKGKLPVAAVSTGFPAGLSSFQTRKKEILYSINSGADEIDIVINRSYVLRNEWNKLYDEIKDFKNFTNNKKLKVIIGTGNIGTLRNVAKASLVALIPAPGESYI